jgi:transcriptional/translational regulatory protein YebC/TACO1
MQKALEERNINVLSSDLQRIPTTTKKLTEEQEEEIFDLLDKFEQDEDVSAVYHTME